MLLAGTIFLGSLGFPALKDIFELNNIRQRIRTPWKPWKLSTRIAFFSSVALVIFGTLVFFLTERNGVLDGLSVAERWIHAIFQSVSPRTAGFNTVDMGILSAPAVILLIFLMFIGGSSGSTAGGIKTSTFMVILLAISATIRGKNSLELGGRSISFELLNKAYTIFVFSASFILISVFFLSWFEPTVPVLDLVFEEVSAFCTVGLTRGITPNLGIPAQMVLIISMFVGRVGTLTLAFSLASRTASTAYRYPRSHVLVG
jgi:Trk-type K+ transport system membrane component